MKVLLLGKSGLLGSYFLQVLAGEEGLDLYAPDKSELDVSDFKFLRSFLDGLKPDFIINCVAYTKVDEAEAHGEEADLLNALLPGELAQFSKSTGAVLLHFSTDYVFDGTSGLPYQPDDSPAPLNRYGESKFAGEQLIKSNCDNYYIVRTSWLFGEGRPNFVDKVLNLAKTQSDISVVDDQYGCPTYALDLVEYVFEYFIAPFKAFFGGKRHPLNLADLNKDNDELLNFGVYHVVNDGVCSWYRLAEEIFDAVDHTVVLKPVKSERFRTIARRPGNSALCDSRLPKLRHWREALRAYLTLKF